MFSRGWDHYFDLMEGNTISLHLITYSPAVVRNELHLVITTIFISILTIVHGLGTSPHLLGLNILLSLWIKYFFWALGIRLLCLVYNYHFYSFKYHYFGEGLRFGSPWISDSSYFGKKKHFFLICRDFGVPWYSEPLIILDKLTFILLKVWW